MHIIYILLLITTSGCAQGFSNKFEVTQICFKSSRDHYGFKIAVLDVKSLDEFDKPLQYDFKEIYATRQKGYHLDYTFKGDSLITDTLQGSVKYDYEFKPQKVIDFFRPDKYFYWSKVSGLETYDYNGRSDALPFKFEKNKWYMIEFVEASTGYEIIFTLTNNGKIRQFHHHIPASW